MPAPRSRRRARIAALVSVVLAITGFQFFLAPPAAQANAGRHRASSSARCTAGVATPVRRTRRLHRAVQPHALADPVAGCRSAVRCGDQQAGVHQLAPASPSAGGWATTSFQMSGAGRRTASRCPTPDCGASHHGRSAGSGFPRQHDAASTPICGQRRPARTAGVIDLVGAARHQLSRRDADHGAGATRLLPSRQRSAAARTPTATRTDFSLGCPEPRPRARLTARSRSTNPGNKTGLWARRSRTSPGRDRRHDAVHLTDPGTTLPRASPSRRSGAVSGTPTTAEHLQRHVSRSPTPPRRPPATDTATFTFTVNAAPSA